MKTIIFATLLLFSIQSPSQGIIRIQPHCKIPALLAIITRHDTYAATIGNTIYISCSVEDFLSDKRWVRHEFTHISQYKRMGTLKFLGKYLIYSLKGYKNNPLEKEAKLNE